MRTSEVVMTSALIGASMGVMIGAGYGGGMALLAESTDVGRGDAITSCDENYNGLVEVVHGNQAETERIFRLLADIALDNGIEDYSATGPRFRSDYATLPGELACLTVVSTDDTQEITAVLLPAGMEALDLGSFRPFTGKTLPDGLEWVSEPGC